ncbi:MAG TPA: integrase core domain-containing protein [Puia sp.]|nr:integrase core domain-containing protein [Puia sp.]
MGIRISMDGKGRALDNVWIERFWKSIKYDCVYLNPVEDGFELYEGVQNHIACYMPNTPFDQAIAQLTLPGKHPKSSLTYENRSPIFA